MEISKFRKSLPTKWIAPRTTILQEGPRGCWFLLLIFASRDFEQSIHIKNNIIMIPLKNSRKSSRTSPRQFLSSKTRGRQQIRGQLLDRYRSILTRISGHSDTGLNSFLNAEYQNNWWAGKCFWKTKIQNELPSALWWDDGDVRNLSYSCSSIFSVNLAPQRNVTLETLKSRLKITKLHQVDGRSNPEPLGSARTRAEPIVSDRTKVKKKVVAKSRAGFPYSNPQNRRSLKMK